MTPLEILIISHGLAYLFGIMVAWLLWKKVGN